ncbi:MAG: hypothetical protein SangKO_037180 [Sandaracinaceae bacterium]
MRRIGITLGLLLAACSDPCTAAGVQTQLDGAGVGGVITLPACRVEGELTVPDGVTLRGVPGSELASAAPRDIVVELRAGAALESVSIDAGGRAAVVMRGDASLRDVTVDARHGVGLYADGGVVTMDGVRVTGPVTPDDAADPRWIGVLSAPPESASCPGASCECEPGAVDEGMGRACATDGRWLTWASTIGLYARGATLTLTDVSFEGFTETGVLTDASQLTWTRGAVRDVIGVGVLMRGGSSSLTDVTVERVVAGLRGVPSYGVIATDGHAMVSDGLTVADGERFGLLVLGATAANADLHARGNGDVAVWAGDSSGFSITGASAVEGNGFAGVVISESSDVTLEGLSVSMTASVRRSVGAFGVQEIGDGVQVIGPGANVVLRDVTLTGNARVGLLADVGPGLAFTNVSVDASGMAFGALGGTRDVGAGSIRVTNPSGWDSGITRSVTASANDSTASGAFDAIVTALPDGVTGATGIIGPMY